MALMSVERGVPSFYLPKSRPEEIVCSPTCRCYHNDKLPEAHHYRVEIVRDITPIRPVRYQQRRGKTDMKESLANGNHTQNHYANLNPVRHLLPRPYLQPAHRRIQRDRSRHLGASETTKGDRRTRRRQTQQRQNWSDEVMFPPSCGIHRK